MRGNDRTRGIVSELIAALMWGPKTIAELREFTGMDENCVRDWVRVLKGHGVVRIEYLANTGGPNLSRVYGIQAKPFDLPDCADVKEHNSGLET